MPASAKSCSIASCDDPEPTTRNTALPCSFMMKYHNIDFPSALKELARRYQIELPEKQYSQAEQEKERLRKAMYAINDKAARLFREYLLQAQGAAKARAYLERRGIPPAIQEKFQLGYAPSVESAGWNFLGSSLQGEESAAAEAVGLLVKNDKGSTYDRFRDRILFPIFDPKGRISGFGGRIVGDGQPKYMNSPESPIFDKSRLLLGLFQQMIVFEFEKKNEIKSIFCSRTAYCAHEVIRHQPIAFRIDVERFVH